MATKATVKMLDEHTEQELCASFDRVTGLSQLCTLATVSPQNAGWANVAFFARTGDWDFLLWSNPDTTHAANAAANPAAALTITDSAIKFGGTLTGLQATGSLKLVKGLAAGRAFTSYVARFTTMLKQMPTYSNLESAAAARFFLFKTATLKLLDEAAYGPYGYVQAEINSN
ncbi:MAG: pyridoxamine 5'-phosphate oxidase family protein [Bifidobacteriaceae bacterium]|jgi:uncharacterized protein YhbP (UPF0306 family)|nr:pyridoxamine 5'-phosphate oxidase family protein [Bifidobacteriaceae bacterium]